MNRRTEHALRVRHHAEHPAIFTDDARDVVDGTVGIGGLVHFAALVGVAKHDLTLVLQALQTVFVDIVAVILTHKISHELTFHQDCRWKYLWNGFRS